MSLRSLILAWPERSIRVHSIQRMSTHAGTVHGTEVPTTVMCTRQKLILWAMGAILTKMLCCGPLFPGASVIGIPTEETWLEGLITYHFPQGKQLETVGDENWNLSFLQACKQLENHHTKFFQPNSPDKVPPDDSDYNLFFNMDIHAPSHVVFVFVTAETIIESKICHPKNNDFYLCVHAGMIASIISTFRS
ncbi:hypothetical protein Bca4012_082294 [Brassica carinata]